MLGSLSEAEDAVQETWLRHVLSITIEHGRIRRLDVIGDPARLERTQVSAFAR